MDVNRLKQMAEEGIELMVRKNQAYSGNSGDNITAGGLHGVATRLMDKVSRLNNLTEHPEDLDFESVEDTLMDIGNYSYIGRLLQEGSWQELPTMVYLAGPIDGINREDAEDWRDVMSKHFNEYGISTFSPTAFRSTPEGAGRTRAINDQAINYSDLVIANLNGPGRAFGTIREIEYARMMGKPVIVIWPEGELIPLYMHDLTVVSDIGVAFWSIVGKSNEVQD